MLIKAFRKISCQLSAVSQSEGLPISFSVTLSEEILCFAKNDITCRVCFYANAHLTNILRRGEPCVRPEWLIFPADS
jgi:hypothetical protein